MVLLVIFWRLGVKVITYAPEKKMLLRVAFLLVLCFCLVRMTWVRYLWIRALAKITNLPIKFMKKSMFYAVTQNNAAIPSVILIAYHL